MSLTRTNAADLMLATAIALSAALAAPAIKELQTVRQGDDFLT
jgi:hypothetical protein